MDEQTATVPSPAPSVAPRWLDEHEQTVWRAFLDMHARLTARLNRELVEQSGISVADFSVLVQLSEHPEGRMRVLELARSLRWEKSRLSHQLTRMQQRDLVRRSNCSEDRRGAFVTLTDAGRATVERAAPAHVDGVRRYLFDQLTPAQVDALGEVARAVTDRLADDSCDISAQAATGCPPAADSYC